MVTAIWMVLALAAMAGVFAACLIVVVASIRMVEGAHNKRQRRLSARR
jgi:hypothetical protein